MAVTIRPSTEGIALSKLKGATNIAAWHSLSSDEARHRLTLGSNAIADVSQHPVQRALGKLWAPVPWMLEAAILLQLFLGDYVEAAVVAFLLVANGAIGFFQEGRAQLRLTPSNRDWRWSRPCNVTECGPQFLQPRSL